MKAKEIFWIMVVSLMFVGLLALGVADSFKYGSLYKYAFIGVIIIILIGLFIRDLTKTKSLKKTIKKIIENA